MRARAGDAVAKVSSTRRSFDWSSSIAWLRSESDEVRYNACALVGLAMGLTTRAVWEMRAATAKDARGVSAASRSEERGEDVGVRQRARRVLVESRTR